MELDFALVADAASSPGDGRLYIHGAGFDSIEAEAFPHIQPRMSLVMRLSTPRHDDETHMLGVILIDSDGGSVIPEIESPLGEAVLDSNALRATYTVIVDLTQLTFPKPGDYMFEITIDGRHAKSIPLSLEETEPE